MLLAMDARWMNDTPSSPDYRTELGQTRRGERLPTALACEVVSHYWDEPLAHTATDISPYGMWIDTVFPLHPGAEVVVAFCSPDTREETMLFARVARVRTGRKRGDRGSLGMALEFCDMSKEQRTRLETSLACTTFAPDGASN